MAKMRKEESKPKQDEQTIDDLQAELIRLQRCFRLLEDDRRSYRQESEYQLRKQNETIRNLKLEHEELAKENKLADSIKNQNADTENKQILRQLLDEEDKVNAEFIEENEKLNAVSSEIKALLRKTDILHKNMGGCKESERKCKAMIKLISVMENRLNAANIKFNVALSQNSEMRQEIDHINKQKNRFKDLHTKLTKMFQTGKEEKEFLIENSTVLFNSRDEAHHRMQSLRERSERDMTQFNAELKDILRIIDHDKKLREFMNTKMEERSEMYEAAVQGRKEKKLLDHIKSLQIEVQHYDRIFEELIEVSGLDNVDEMVSKFIRVEDENFASFNFVKEQNQSIQFREGAVLNFRSQMNSLGQNEVILEKKHKDILNDIKEMEQHQLDETQRIQTQMKTDEKKLEKIRCATDKIFGRARCNRSVMNELLGGSKIKNENLLSYLGLIEQRASELAQARALLCLKNGGELPEPEHVRHLTLATVGKIARAVLIAPSINTDGNEMLPANIQEPVKPMSHAEAKDAAQSARKNEIKTAGKQ